MTAEDAMGTTLKRMVAAVEELSADQADQFVAPFIRKRNPSAVRPMPEVLKRFATGAGAATQRSGKGGKSGGGMGGQQAGGIRGGGKRKTHAGRK